MHHENAHLLRGYGRRHPQRHRQPKEVAVIASNIPLTTATTVLLPILASTRELIITNSSASAGNATFSTDAVTAAFSNQTLAAGASVTLTLTPGAPNIDLGNLTAYAASTAYVTAQRVPF